MNQLSKWLFIGGLVMIVLGFLAWIIPFGKLPGDIHYKGEKIQIYFPIVTSIILSLLLSLVFWLFKK